VSHAATENASSAHLAGSDRRLRTYWLMGLPFDCVSLDEAVRLVLQAAHNRHRMLFSTPNVNFLAEALRDAEFRSAILRTDMSLADGMPVVWIGRWLGIPFPERVAGSALMDRLRETRSGRKLRVFFFGGALGSAELASEALRRQESDLIAAGHLFPDYGSAQDLSSSANIASINAAHPDLLVVALGAKKGHLWLDANWGSLDVPVASHLGAVVSFVAGTVKRAPAWVQRIGAEWFWRVREEPHLARRYLLDALTLARLLVTNVAPMKLLQLRQRLRKSTCMVRCCNDGAAGLIVTVSGSVQDHDVPDLEAALAGAWQASVSKLRLELSGCTFLSPRALGWLHALRTTKSHQTTIGIEGLDNGPVLSVRLQNAAGVFG
jgi:N-acetylglucosaminyldiphosphoundecaprenol N-acetyl-beta-D-mannosaminyltransferase